MIGYAAEAIDQIDALRLHFVGRSRIEAAMALDRALDEAESTIQTRPEAGLFAPRPYPNLVRPDRRWIKAGRYWITYSFPPPVVLGVYYEEADIPGRL